MSSAPTPTARSLITRYVASLGGREALLARRSARWTATVELPTQRMTGMVETLAAAPNRIVTTLTLSGVGTIKSGYDGSVGWSIHPALGPRILRGPELAEIRRLAEFHSELHEQPDAQFVFDGTDTFEGRECYKLVVTRDDSLRVTEYFDRATGLLAGSVQTRETPAGSLTITTIHDDYRRFGNTLAAAKTTQRFSSGLTQVITITSMTYNDVPDGAFALPPEVRARVGK